MAPTPELLSISLDSLAEGSWLTLPLLPVVLREAALIPEYAWWSTEECEEEVREHANNDDPTVALASV